MKNDLSSNSQPPNLYSYRFGFNGQEKDDEICGAGSAYEYEYEYEFRMYDSKVGRFWSVDPLMASYPWNSTYAFAENTPIWARESEGLEAWYTTNENGQQERIEGAAGPAGAWHSTIIAYNTSSSTFSIYDQGTGWGIKNASQEKNQEKINNINVWHPDWGSRIWRINKTQRTPIIIPLNNLKW